MRNLSIVQGIITQAPKLKRKNRVFFRDEELIRNEGRSFFKSFVFECMNHPKTNDTYTIRITIKVLKINSAIY